MYFTKMLGAAAIASAAIFSTGAALAEVDTLKIGTTTTLPAMPLVIGQKKGFFAEEGLEVELEKTNGATTVMMPMLAQGGLDMVMSGPSASLFNSMSQGMGIKIVSDVGQLDPSADGAPFVIVVRKDLLDSGELTKLEDLKGRPITMGVDGTPLAFMMIKALQKVGLGEADIDPKYFRALPDMVAALQNKVVDVSAMIVPFDAQLARDGIAVSLVDAAEVAPNMQAFILLANEKFVANDELRHRFFRAYRKSVDWYREHLNGDRTELVEMATEFTGMSKEQIEVSAWAHYEENLQLNEASLVEQYDMWVAKGLAAPGLDMAAQIINPPLND